MEFNNDFFLIANGYKITDGYNYGDKHHYIVIIFDEFFEEHEHTTVYQMIFGKNYENNKSAYIFNNKYDDENGNEVHITVITQKIEKKEKTFIQINNSFIKIGIDNNNKNYIKCVLPIKIDNKKHKDCYDYFTSNNSSFKYSKNVEIKDFNNKTSIIRVI